MPTHKSEDYKLSAVEYYLMISMYLRQDFISGCDQYIKDVANTPRGTGDNS